MEIGLIIFDCDGVLIDSEILAAKIHAAELTRIGYPVTAEEVVRRYTGKHGREIRAMIEDDWGRPLPADYFTQTDRLMDRAYACELRMTNGLTQVLDHLTMEFCVASNTRLERLCASLRAVGLETRFRPPYFQRQHGQKRQAGPRFVSSRRRGYGS